jgi:hypothetical protein
MMCAQALQCRDDCFLIHLHRVGDHTRGLFEAEASIAVSAAHALEDVKVFFFVGHCSSWILPNSTASDGQRIFQIINISISTLNLR